MRSKVVEPSVEPSSLDRDTYMVQHTAAGDYFWQWIGDQSATYSPAYSFPAETQFDSVVVDPGIHYFRVIAHHTWGQYRFWESNPDSGYSVDNEYRANLSAGWQRIAFDGRDANGALLPSGVYFYRVTAAGMATTSKMVNRR